MIKVWFFLWKYKILKDVGNLSLHTESFFQLSEGMQKSVLDKYFERFASDKGIEMYFDSKESRYYDGSFEITFFHCYYFDKKLIDYDVKCIRLIDKFRIDSSEKDYLISYALERIRDEKLDISVSDFVGYPDDLPLGLSSNLDFMRYLVSLDEANIKYITYCDKYITGQRELIKEGIERAEKKNYSLRRFLKNDGNLPKILERNFDFLIYLIRNDVENICYLDEVVLENLTIGNKRKFIDTVIESLKKNSDYLVGIEKDLSLSGILNQDEEFIRYIVSLDIDNVKYVDFYHLTDSVKERVIDYITDLLEDNDIYYDIMKKPFRELFFQNEKFMHYLIKRDFRWIAVMRVNSDDGVNRLVDEFFMILKNKHYRFRLEDFLEDGKYLNERLVENVKMLHYFLVNKVAVCQYIDFFHLSNAKLFVSNLLNEMDSKYYEFRNDDFLLNGKYPIVLSNSERFMRYVIDKNFNHLAYMDISMVDKRSLRKLINYAFRMAYYIRGNNNKLSFDIDGYFKGTDIYEDEYFQECLDSF